MAYLAKWWINKNGTNTVECQLCPHYCKINTASRGICQVRENQAGKLYSLNYGYLVAAAVDPIEKKPLYHFYPGADIFSIACLGCNFKCPFCQNWHISQPDKEFSPNSIFSAPEKIVSLALENKSIGIAYTYSEPTVYLEYVYDLAKIAYKKGLVNVLVSNGYINEQPRKEIIPYLNGANIDLKSIKEEFYQKYCQAKLAPVKESIIDFHANKIWLEITTLVIPGLNDSEEELKAIAEFICSVDQNIPWHISRFYPNYKLNNLPATDLAVLEKAYCLGKDVGLKYIYLGNIGREQFTYCPECSAVLIERIGYRIKSKNIKKGKCLNCNAQIAGVWE